MTKKFLITSIVSASLLFIGFLVVAIILATVDYAPLGVDNAVADWAYSVRGEQGGATYWFFRIVTEFGYTYFCIAIILIMGIIWRFRSKTWFFAGTILISWVLQQIIKAIVDRPRPDEALWWMTETSSSFPSGHSITAACVFVLLAYFIISSPKVKAWVKWLIGILSAAAIVLVPISRIILGVHYLTDVLAGVFFGAFVAVLGIIVYNLFLHFRDRHKSNKPAPTTNESASTPTNESTPTTKNEPASTTRTTNPTKLNLSNKNPLLLLKIK